jgi:Ser-tRNA(Ala) deacylase AlaX
MSMEELSARMAALQQRVSELEGSGVAPDAGSPPDLYHDRFESRPPPKSHTTDLAACQRDSMLRMLTTTVVACEQKPKAEATGGKKKKKKGSSIAQPDLWLVQLGDTVLFPEGGGQPADTGTIAVAGGENEPVRVSHVYRTPDGVVLHEASSALSVGASVVVTLDWERRFDHMQCHSAQHLISALALRSGTITPGRPEHQIKTHSWELGSSSVVVELEVDSTTPEGEAAISEIEEVRRAPHRPIHERFCLDPGPVCKTRERLTWRVALRRLPMRLCALLYRSSGTSTLAISSKTARLVCA